MPSKQAAKPHHPELQAADAPGGGAHGLELELDVHGARLQPWLDNSVARVREVWCRGIVCCRDKDELRPCCGAD